MPQANIIALHNPEENSHFSVACGKLLNARQTLLKNQFVAERFGFLYHKALEARFEERTLGLSEKQPARVEETD